jgi:P4 family phage/plasmid primase-like protien
MNTIGTETNPIESKSPIHIGRAIVKDQFASTVGTVPPLVFRKGLVHEWAKGRWVEHPLEWLEDLCWRALDNAHCLNSSGVVSRYMPSTGTVRDIAKAISVQSQLLVEHLPHYFGTEPPEVDGDWKDRTIAFENVLLIVQPSGEMLLLERDQRWLDSTVLPVEFDEEAKCSLWKECLDQWSDSDQAWQDLLQEWFGYCLMTKRNYQRWLMMHGRTRAGKGVITGVLKDLLGTSLRSTSLQKLGSRFGLDGLQNARVYSVAEVSKMSREDTERAAMTVKTIVGQDPCDVEPKGRPIIRNVVLSGALMMQGNEIPTLTNKGMGVSSKMLGLPFERSFLGKEDPDLAMKLRSELGGIAVWAVVGAARLVGQNGKFTKCDRSVDVERMFLHNNNPIDAFLEARFVKSQKGFTRFESVWTQWKKWVKDNHIRDSTSRNRLPSRIVSESSWYTRKGRRGSGPRGLWGITPRYEPQDEAVM